MFIVESYGIAVVMCFVTMICWGSWANTQKMAGKEWPFQLFYWDYAIGVLLFALALAFTLGSMGHAGRSFVIDLRQASLRAVGLALLGGVIFNLANILLVSAIDIAGMAVAFPIAIGFSLSLGVILNYFASPVGNPILLFLGVAGVLAAVVVDAMAYRRVPSQGVISTRRGISISIASGVLMGFFYRFVAASMSPNFKNPEPGTMTPYTALVVFSLGLFISNFIWNSYIMATPFSGAPVSYRDYFKKGNARLHSIGILGGAVWNLGMSFSIIAAGAAGFAISYGLGQGGTMVAAFWGVFIWKEFKNASRGTNKLIALMFILYFVSLSLIVLARMM
jgi:glucose uptake protein